MLCTQHKMSHRWKSPKISITCSLYGPEIRPLITECIKKQQNHLRRFFLSYIPASIPSRPKRSLTSFPQCWHLISRAVHSVSVPSSSKMRRLHLGLGHLIASICRLLLYSTPASNRPYFPPSRTDMQQGNQTNDNYALLGSLLSFVHYRFSACSPISVKSITVFTMRYRL